jgi:hypothetical protein
MAIAYEGDYEFGRAYVFDKSYKGLSAKCPEYSEIFKTFSSNMDRVIALIWLPHELCFWTHLLEYSHCFARANMGLSLDDFSKDGTPEFEKFASVVWAANLPTKAPDPFRVVWERGNHTLKYVLSSEIIGKQPKYRTAGLETILATLITSAYAAFENLAGDLWVAAVNKHPALAQKYLENGEKQINLDVLARYNFDMSKSMGKVLFETRKVSFQSFNDIKEAYKGAFSKHVDDVFADTTEIYHTEKVRHLIAHRNGVVDEKFKKEIKSNADYADVPVGTHIPYSGPLAVKHIDVCVKTGVHLFKTVDDWSA